MNATDFCFDQNYLSDFGCIIASFGDSSDEVSGGTTEYDSVKAPNSDKFKFYGSQYNEVLTWSFSVIKNPCITENMEFSHKEERKLMKWLKRTDGYKWFKFVEGSYGQTVSNNYVISLGTEVNTNSEEDIYYQVKVDVKPHRIGGRTLGYDLTITANCAYGFTDLIEKSASITSSSTFKFNVDTDANEYIYPEKVIIRNGTTTSFVLENTYDSLHRINLDTATKFSSIPTNSTLTLDCENQIITGLNDPTQFNWYFPRLVDRNNEFSMGTSEGKLDITIQYREARMVMI